MDEYYSVANDKAITESSDFSCAKVCQEQSKECARNAVNPKTLQSHPSYLQWKGRP